MWMFETNLTFSYFVATGKFDNCTWKYYRYYATFTVLCARMWQHFTVHVLPKFNIVLPLFKYSMRIFLNITHIFSMWSSVHFMCLLQVRRNRKNSCRTSTTKMCHNLQEPERFLSRTSSAVVCACLYVGEYISQGHSLVAHTSTYCIIIINISSRNSIVSVSQSVLYVWILERVWRIGMLVCCCKSDSGDCCSRRLLHKTTYIYTYKYINTTTLRVCARCNLFGEFVPYFGDYFWRGSEQVLRSEASPKKHTTLLRNKCL